MAPFWLSSNARRLLGLLSEQLTEVGNEAWKREDLEKYLRRAAWDPDDRELLAQAQWQTARGFLDRVAVDTGILAQHDGPRTRWRYLHRSLRERLAAEVLAANGTERISRKIRWIARSPDGLGQWGETLGMACGLLDDPSAPLRVLCEADVALALRVLPELSGLRPETALDSLLGSEPRKEANNHIWDGQTLHRLAAKWPVEEAVLKLTARVTPDIDLDRLAFIHYALTQLGRLPPRASFFAAAGRPVDGSPPIPWLPIQPGLFRMGGPRHDVPVYLSHAFEMSGTPVTVGQYTSFDPDHECPGGSEHPVTMVSWWRAWLFAAWVGGGLPTEAQWEYTCRAGASTLFWSGDDPSDMARVGWYFGNSREETHPVARKPANPWGLFDMHGNVWEWCMDGAGATDEEPADDAPAFDAPAAGTPLVNPMCPPANVERVMRGGSFFEEARGCSSVRRVSFEPGFQCHHFGFRLVRPLPQFGPTSEIGVDQLFSTCSERLDHEP